MSEAIDLNTGLSEQARSNPADVPLEKIDLSDPSLYEHDLQWGFFERLRKEAPVHYYCRTALSARSGR